MYCKRVGNYGLVLILVLSLAGPIEAQAQAPANAGDAAVQNVMRVPLRVLPAARLEPSRTSRMPQLSDLTQVKLVTLEGEWQLVMMLESFRTEKQTGIVTKFREETRTRTVRNDQGRDVEQSYTVTVPFHEEGEVQLKIPAGRKPVSKPASHFRFFDLSGKELTVEQVENKLPQLRAAFLLDRFAGELPELPGLYREVLSHDCLLITCEERIREDNNQPMFPALPARDFMPKPIER